MFYLRRVIFAVLVFLCIPWGVLAAERIENMDVRIDLQENRRMTIEETIRYDFGAAFRHGIYRIIPDTYDRQGTKYRLRFDLKEVTMDGHPVPWKQDRASGGVEVRIGDPDQTIQGVHTYKLVYETERAINAFPEGDELYWNVTGDAWDVEIVSTQFRLNAPAASIKHACFAGVYGSTQIDCQILSQGTQVFASTTRALHPREGLTVVIQLPPGTIAPMGWGERLTQIVLDNSWLLLPFLVFVFMFLLWWRRGREPKGRGTIIPHYEPPRDFPPAMLVSLIEQRMSQRAVTATILDLARRGFMTVNCTPTLSITKKKEDADVLRSFEKILYDGLLLHREKVTLTELKGTFWKPIEESREKLFDELRERMLFEKNPSVVRGLWSVIAVVCAMVGFFGAGSFGPSFLWSLLACAMIIFFFGWQMPRMTKEGAILVEEAKGFKLFLSVTEKARLDFTDAPERTPEQFAQFLPAAVAFGVEEKWAKQFAGIDMQAPNYLNGTWSSMNSLAFAHALTQLHDTTAGAYAAPSSAGSGGSGFSGGGSGGGFGGGGGGSW